MKHMAEGLYALDAEGLVTYLNPAASKMLGWPPEELLGKPMHDMVHFQQEDGTPVPASECPLFKVRSLGQTIRVTLDAFTRKDGSIFPVSYSSAPLRGGTTIEGVVVVFRDITDERDELGRIQRDLAALSWLGRIRDALDEDRMVMYSQPIISASGGPPSEELLLRMISRTGQIIAPGAFLPVAEKYGLITEIDRWVATQAIRLAATGRRVDANLSAATIGGLDILPLIERELRATGADPANVIFEITETVLIGDLEAGEAFAKGLTDLGCGVALDDFGTGFGSFTYLKRLPIDYLKIDIEFVRDVLTNSANQHLVRAIIGLAKAFKIQTVAEGVEDEGTWDFLRQEGVDFGQGFHLGRPGPIEPHHGSARMEYAGLSIDIATREVLVDGRVVELTSREFDLLAQLAAAPRHVFSREQLLVTVWHSSSDWQTSKTVTEHIRRIRHKIDSNPSRPRWIKTVAGAGYRFEP
jgi:PAS domain S-box-containing protein